MGLIFGNYMGILALTIRMNAATYPDMSTSNRSIDRVTISSNSEPITIISLQVCQRNRFRIRNKVQSRVLGDYMFLSSGTSFPLRTDLGGKVYLRSDLRRNGAYKNGRLLYYKRPDESAKGIVDFLL